MFDCTNLILILDVDQDKYSMFNSLELSMYDLLVHTSQDIKKETQTIYFIKG